MSRADDARELLDRTTEALESISRRMTAGTACAALRAISMAVMAFGTPMSMATRNALLALIAAVRAEIPE